MNLLIILLLSVGCLDITAAHVSTRPSNLLDKLILPMSKIKLPLPFNKVKPLSFRASTDSTPAFDARRQLSDNLINKLPLIQQEVLFALLTNRSTKIGEHASKRYRNNKHRREPVLLTNRSELRLMEQVATKKGYKQLIRERHILHGLNEDINILGINNILNPDFRT